MYIYISLNISGKFQQGRITYIRIVRYFYFRAFNWFIFLFCSEQGFTAEVALESVSLDALSLCLPVSLLISGKLEILWGILVFILLVVFCIVYAVHTFRVYILCKGGEIYEG